MLTACAWLLVVGVLEWRNPRLVPSWHGFVHSAIVARFPSPSLVPENPFFAGEPLPYYWLYHWIAAGVVKVTGVNPLGALQMLALLSLAVLVVLAIDVGRRVIPATGAGLLIGFLALAGVNPLGPLIAVAHGARHDAPSAAADQASVETVFVSDVDADRMMSRPLLGNLYFGTDWRNGQNLVWFWDISSRAPALATLMLLAWILVRGRHRAMLAFATLLLTGLNPVIGIAVAGSLAGSLILLGLADRRSAGVSRWAAVALAVGVVLALPTFVHLFHYGGVASVSTLRWILLKGTYLTLDFGVVVALALWASARASEADCLAVRALTGAGLSLLGLTMVVGLAEGNEHNLANAAGVLLAVPAGLAPWYGRTARLGAPTFATRAALVVALIHLPMTAATIAAFDGRPALPFHSGRRLERIPAEHPVARLHEWIRRETSLDAVLVTDPDRPMKMSGNVSELPAFTGRTLFVDQPSYLTRPHPEFSSRLRVARALIGGEDLSPIDREAISRLARPTYLVIADPALRSRLERQHGPPVFAADYVSVFRITDRQGQDQRSP